MSRFFHVFGSALITCMSFSATVARATDAAVPTPVPVTSQVFMMERYYSSPSSQKVDPPTRVGDIIRFRWVGSVTPPGSAVEVVALEQEKSLSSLGWEVYSQPKDDRTSAFSVIPLRPGSLQLPPLAVRDAEKKVLGTTLAIQFEIQPAASPEELEKKPPDFLPPVGMKLPWYWVVGLVVCAVLLLGSVGYVVWRVLRRHKSKKPQVNSATSGPALSEDEQALKSLEKIERERLWTVQQYKPHYFGVSEVLKRYIEARYHFDATECTTREMLEALKERGLEKAKLSTMSQLYELLDRVKFTDFTPDADECLEILKLARSWIMTTRVAEVKNRGANGV